MKRKILITIAAFVGVSVAAAVVVPVLRKHNDGFPDGFNDHVLHERAKTFAKAEDAPDPGDGEGRFVLPSWVPRDATDARSRFRPRATPS
ncbi:hypothetical protein [Streptomyces spiralis]|nr:hypothetical protein [Streptomyces spiralis]